MYRSLKATTGDFTESVDANGIMVYSIDATAAFVSQEWTVDRSSPDFTASVVVSADYDGSGTASLQYSHDGITWRPAYSQSDSELTMTLLTSVVCSTESITSDQPVAIRRNWKYGRYRIKQNVGSGSAGSVIIYLNQG